MIVGKKPMIYFIQAKNSGHVKIGVSNSPKKRLLMLQTGSPEPLELLAVVPGGRDQERALHERFASFRVHGEWFRMDEEILREIRWRRRKPIGEVFRDANSFFWSVKGEVFNGTTKADIELYCLTRNLLPPDPARFLAALTKDFNWCVIEEITNVSHFSSWFYVDEKLLRTSVSDERRREAICYVASGTKKATWRYVPGAPCTVREMTVCPCCNPEGAQESDKRVMLNLEDFEHVAQRFIASIPCRASCGSEWDTGIRLIDGEAFLYVHVTNDCRDSNEDKACGQAFISCVSNTFI